MEKSDGINWKAEQDRFERVAYPSALRAARRTFRRWHGRKRDDAEAEFMAKRNISPPERRTGGGRTIRRPG